MANVYCSIDNCHYWAQGNQCKASEILVTSDTWAQEASEAIDAVQHMEVPTNSASSCMDTCCKTFVHIGGPTEVDGVTRN